MQPAPRPTDQTRSRQIARWHARARDRAATQPVHEPVPSQPCLALPHALCAAMLLEQQTRVGYDLAGELNVPSVGVCTTAKHARNAAECVGMCGGRGRPRTSDLACNSRSKHAAKTSPCGSRPICATPIAVAMQRSRVPPPQDTSRHDHQHTKSTTRDSDAHAGARRAV